MGQDMIIIILANNSYYNDNYHKDCVIIALYFISLHDTKTVVEQSFFLQLHAGYSDSGINITLIWTV